MSSYDRMFPNQDFVAPDALGNLVALPLQYTSRSENKTVFIDIDTMQAYSNQWVILQNIVKISMEGLLNILDKHIINNSNANETLMPWQIQKDKPLSFPKSTQAVLHNIMSPLVKTT